MLIEGIMGVMIEGTMVINVEHTMGVKVEGTMGVGRGHHGCQVRGHLGLCREKLM